MGEDGTHIVLWCYHAGGVHYGHDGHRAETRDKQFLSEEVGSQFFPSEEVGSHQVRAHSETTVTCR